VFYYKKPKMSKLEHTNAGLKVEGELEEVAQVARKIEEKLESSDVKRESIECFNEWRPREEDSEKDVKEKTIKQAVITKKDVEKDVEHIEEKLSYSIRDIQNSATEKSESVSKLVFKLAFSKTVKVTRKTEALIYSKLMLKFNPYYFDSHDLSANLKCDQKDNYCLDINLMEENARKRLKEEFSD